MADAAPFSAVVVTHNSERELPVLLDSIDRHLDPRPQVIVVDAGLRRTARRPRRAAAPRWWPWTRTRASARRTNAGVELAATDVTVLLNPDVELLDDGLARLAAIARGRPVLAAPRLLNADRTVQRSAHPRPAATARCSRRWCTRALLPAPAAPERPTRGASDAPRRVGWAVAACVAARTDVLRSLGPFDPAQFLFYEDMDLCLRARGGGRCRPSCTRSVAVVHTGGHSTGPAYGGEPHALLARRRREVVAARLGRRAAALDDLAQAATFATRAARAASSCAATTARERAQLSAVSGDPPGLDIDCGARGDARKRSTAPADCSRARLSPRAPRR